ncbi:MULTISPECIES: hypothetical protein [unclassified Streptomyces]|uniref:hypothetical protein n=1 Tax=unclassified Streptomyces TaxID=2593676 RepID=UPI002E2DA310|nr:hypothetical protein [Streptomyces sp. NBC_00223]
MTEYLNFLGTTLRIDVDAAAEEAFAPVRRFFRGLFAPDPRQAVTFTVAVHAYDPDSDVDPGVWTVEQSEIRRSTAKEFTFDAHVVDRDGRRHYINRATYLDAPLDALTDPVFGLRITPDSTVQVLDFLRDLVIRHEESRGTVVLHASGVCDKDSAVAIAGPKGAGKTTTLLSALRDPGWRYFTGDKLFCERVDGEVLVHPWRDYPYVGVGTILADPRLTDLVRRSVAPDVERRPVGEKLLMDPDVFESWLGAEFSAEPKRLAALLLPQVRPGEPLRVRALTEDNERWAQLNKIIDRQADTTFFTWQSYLVPDYTSFYASLAQLRHDLADTPMVRLRGTLDIDVDAVLDRVRTGAEAE